MMAFGAPTKYAGLSMDKAHRKVVETEGLNDMHFDATAENLQRTLVELGIAPDLVSETMAAVAGLREQVLCRGPWAIDKEPKKSLYERVGGEPAIDAAVDLFYKKVLADERINSFFKKTNMVHQAKQQKAFLTTALGGPNVYTGRPMDAAHRKLVEKEGLSDVHFNAVAENLEKTLYELGVAKDVVEDIIAAVAGLRDQVLCRGKWA